MATMDVAGSLGAAAPASALPGVPLRVPRRAARRGLPRSRVLVGAGAALVALGFFVSSALNAGSVYYLTVAELQAKGAAGTGERVRVAARVLEGSIEREAGLIRFTIVDDPTLDTVKQPTLLERLLPQPAPAAAPAPVSATAAAAAGAHQMTVTYRGVVPDVFAPDVEVVVEGKLSQDGVFDASTLLAKCPSRYEGTDQPGQPAAGSTGGSGSSGLRAPAGTNSASGGAGNGVTTGVQGKGPVVGGGR